MLLLVQLTDCDTTPAPWLYAFKEILTFAKARPAQMIFITTSIHVYVCMLVSEYSGTPP